MASALRWGNGWSLVGSVLRISKGDSRSTKVLAEGLRRKVLRVTIDCRGSDIGELRSIAIKLDIASASVIELRSLVSRQSEGTSPIKRGGDGVTIVAARLSLVRGTRWSTLPIVALSSDLLIGEASANAGGA